MNQHRPSGTGQRSGQAGNRPAGQPGSRPAGQPSGQRPVGAQGNPARQPAGSPTNKTNSGKPSGQKTGKKVPSGVSHTFAVVYGIFRILFVPALCLAALAIGLTIGYSTIGGGEASDVFKLETWKHLYDLVFEGTR